MPKVYQTITGLWDAERRPPSAAEHTLCLLVASGAERDPSRARVALKTQLRSHHLSLSDDCNLFQKHYVLEVTSPWTQLRLCLLKDGLWLPCDVHLPSNSFLQTPRLTPSLRVNVFWCDRTQCERRTRPSISFYKEQNGFSTPQRSWDSSLVTQPVLKHSQKSLLRTSFF